MASAPVTADPARSRCPHCGLRNPPQAERCDCGYDFRARSVLQSYLGKADASTVRLTLIDASTIPASVILWLLFLGLAPGRKSLTNFGEIPILVVGVMSLLLVRALVIHRLQRFRPFAVSLVILLLSLVLATSLYFLVPGLPE